MVKLDDKPFTELQQEKINVLMERSKKIQKDISEIRREIALNLSMDYDQNIRRRKKIAKLEDDYKDICRCIETVMNARSYYDELLADISKKLDMADNIKEMYGF